MLVHVAQKCRFIERQIASGGADPFSGNTLWRDNMLSLVLRTNYMFLKWEFDDNCLSVSFQVINLLQQSTWLQAEWFHYDLKRMSHGIRLLLRKQYFSYLFTVIRMMSLPTVHKSLVVQRSSIFSFILLRFPASWEPIWVTALWGPQTTRTFHLIFLCARWMVVEHIFMPNNLKIRIRKPSYIFRSILSTIQRYHCI